MNILFLFLGLIIGSLIIYFQLKPKLKSVQILDKDIIHQNEKLKNDNFELSKEYESLRSKKEEILNSIENLKEQSENSAKLLFEKSYELANEKMNNAAEKMSKEYQQAEEDAKQEYLKLLEEYNNSFQQKISNKENELKEINIKLKELSEKVSAAVEADKRAMEIKNKNNFYRLILSEQDLNEIQKLSEVRDYLRNSEPLNKVIWKVYYEKPYSDLIGRVVGSGVHTGIYKITNIENGMCYVGQAVNIADRWRQHIKRGLGAETPTKNKLYPAMSSFGVENFTFEIIEECEKNLLNEREDYWQNYFKAKEFGYSIK